MRKYKYTAVNVSKKKFTGFFLAEDENHLRQQLAQQQLYLISCSIASDKSPNPFFSVSGKVKLAEITTFCRQFSIMLNSGISIIDSLAQLRAQPYTAFLKKILAMIFEDVKVGNLLSDAFKKHGKVFPEFFCSMVYVGEVSGSLETVLVSLADYYDNEVILKRKISGALRYPMLMGVMLVGVILLMLLFIVPQFEDTLSTMQIETNTLTTIVFTSSKLLRENWKFILYGLIIIIAVLYVFLRTEFGKNCKDVFLYKAPMFKNVQINIVASKFAKSLSLLLSSGMDLIDALNVIKNLLGNRYAKREFQGIIDDVEQGVSLTFAIGVYNIFPQMLVQLVSTGEKTGQIESILERATKFFDSQVENAILKVTSRIQPIMLGIMGLVIGGMFIAIYSPMIAIMQNDFAGRIVQKIYSCFCKISL